MQYRRALIEGGTYFFTVNLAERKNGILIDEIDKLRIAFKNVKQKHPFELDAMVVLPDHLHAIMTLPEKDKDYSTRWMLIKAAFSRQLPKQERISRSRQSKGERGIWQRRFWEHLIRDESDYEKHVDYIHYNPVKHGYVSCACDWLHSSIHRYIDRGLLKNTWGCKGQYVDEEMSVGESV